MGETEGVPLSDLGEDAVVEVVTTEGKEGVGGCVCCDGEQVLVVGAANDPRALTPFI